MNRNKKILYKVIAATLAALTLASSTASAYADYRDAGSFIPSTDGAFFISSENGQRYYQHNEGGYMVAVPYNSEYQKGKQVANQMFTYLFDIYKSGIGQNYEPAGFKYTGLGTIAGVQTKYFTKSIAFEPYLRSLESIPATSDIGQKHNVEFRYAGVLINPSNAGSNNYVVNNPGFPLDVLREMGANDEGASPVYQYAARGASEEKTMYANVGANLENNYLYYKWMKPLGTWSGTAGVPSNAATVYNLDYDTMKQTFETWAERSAIGQIYKEEYEQTDPNWWNIANKVFRIDGDIKNDQSVIISAVYEVDNHVYYRSYAIPQPYTKNVIPAVVQILNQNDVVLDSSRKMWTNIEDPYNGVPGMVTNEQNDGQPVKLTKGETYKINLGLAYFTEESEASLTDQSTTVPVEITTRGNVEDVQKTMRANASTTLVNPSTMEDMALNNKTSGGINPKTRVSPASADGETVDYGVGMAPYMIAEFIVDDSIPKTGTIQVTVPSVYATNGDDQVASDNVIEISYTVEDEAPNPDTNPESAPGDMNIGRREYRRLHHMVTEEVPTGEVDEVTGEEITEMVDFEYVTDFGWYDSPSDAGEGDPAGEWSGLPDVGDGWNYAIDSESWWEYASEWPDQIEDLDWKCWLIKDGEYDPSGTFTRSELNDNPFDLGFTISRNRGETTVQNPTLELNIYGVSPDTGEDGELIAQYSDQSVTGNTISSYTETDAYYRNILIDGACDEYYPFVRVEAKIDTDVHGESGIYGATAVHPYNNGWEDAHDTVVRTFQAEPDDMRIMEVEIRDSEGIVIYHADRYDSDQMDVTVDGYFDKEEDCTMKVVIEQNLAADHVVKDPAIDVQIDGCNQSGYSISTYVDTTLTNYGELGEGVQTTYANIAFRPKDVSKINFDIAINDKHGADGWRENIWNEDDDHYNDTIDCTTADLSVSQDIELYNSKNNRQDYLTFAEYLSFKFNIKHIGNNERARRVVGGSTINPYAKLNVKIYNADKLTKDNMTHQLKYSNVYLEDPKASDALVRSMDISAKSRLFPGLGTNGYASHVQVWIEDYIVESWKTETGNVAAYGDILVTGNIDQQHDYNETNIRNNDTDYVQKEFKGEKDFQITDMAVTTRNSISADTGLSVQVAIKNIASSFNDQTVTDKTYLDVYVDDELMKTVVVELPVGDTTVTEVVIPKVDLEKCLPVEVRVNTGKHQTHYEYVLETTNTTANQDPFFNNYKMMTVCPNLPNENECPDCTLEGAQEVKVEDIFREENP